MVRAILDGTKTQTRRVVKPQPEGLNRTLFCSHFTSHGIHIKCPYGQPGDQLWVREAWRCVWSAAEGKPFLQYKEGGDFLEPKTSVEHNQLAKYLPDGTDSTKTPFRPSIHMLRWTSRITLEVTSIRVERLQKISPHDALSEGVGHDSMGNPVTDYQNLWNRINGPDSWNANPWVWVITFKRL
jgi:hypothetical protein